MTYSEGQDIYSAMPQNPSFGGEKIYTVTELNLNLQKCVQAAFPQFVWITGEVVDFRGQVKDKAVYFMLKDGTSALRMVWWPWKIHGQLPPDFQNGAAVEIYGKVDVYAGRGECQIAVEKMQMRGEGSEMLKLKALMERLSKEGLFLDSRKRALPPFPKKIGLITAENAAAMGDFMRGLGNRQGDLTILFFPATMQGKKAPESIASWLWYINKYQLCEVIVLTRGGGSKEDLTAFNDESLVRAIAASQIPVISAVGHQQDYTLCDEVADKRAMTPTDAAKCVVQEASRVRDNISFFTKRILGMAENMLTYYRRRLDIASGNRYLASPNDTLLQWRKARVQQLSQLVHAHPQRISSNLALRVKSATGSLAGYIPTILPERKASLEQLSLRLARHCGASIRTYRERLNSANDKLRLLGPQAVLERGYAIVFNASGKVLTSTQGANQGDSIKIRLADGDLAAKVEDVNHHDSK